MKFSRRDLLQGSSALAIAAAIPSFAEEAKAWIHGSVATGFNGGVTQSDPTTTGDFFFINFFKGSRAFAYSSQPTDPTAPGVPIAELDANGYPTSIVPGTGGWFAIFPLLKQVNYSGQWIFEWDGTGTCSLRNFLPSGVTTTSNSIIFTSNYNGTDNAEFVVSATSAAPNHVRNVRLTRYQNAVPDDRTLLANGAVFFPDFINLYKSAKFGCMRSLTCGSSANGTNTSTLATWAQRRSLTWGTYQGQQFRSDWYGGFTTNSGSDYSLTFPGWALTDKNVVQFVANVTSPQNGRTSLAWSTTNGAAININWPAHGLAVGNVVAFGQNGQPPAALTPAQHYFINNVIDADNFTISVTSGGASVLANATTSGTMFAVSVVRLNINSTGFFQIASQSLPIDATNIFSTGRITNTSGLTNQITTATYDSITQAYWIPQDNVTGGMPNQFPPELWVDFCAQVGSHPWLVTPFLAAEDAAGGYSLMVNWASYATSTYPWMKPVIEPPNETWGSGRSGFTASTSYAPDVALTLWNSNDLNQAYGRWASRIGQAISTLYGNDRTKYSMIVAVQTSLFNAVVNVQSDPRLTSALDVSMSGGSPAYLWVDRVCGANYYSALERFTVNEVQDAFSYVVTNGGTNNPSTPAQFTIADSYAATADTTSGTGSAFNLTYILSCFTNLKAWGLGGAAGSSVPTSGNTVKGVVSYEGGWGPDFLTGNWATTLASPGATQANPCVVTLNTTNGTSNPEKSGMAGNPALVGMSASFASVAGMTQLNNPTLNCTFTLGQSLIAATNTLLVNQAITFPTTSPSANMPADTSFHVVSATSSTFEVALTRGGTPLVASKATTFNGAQPGWFVSAVGTSTITLDVDSSAFSAWTSGGSATWMNSKVYSNVLRVAGGNSNSNGALNTKWYGLYAGLAQSGFVAEFPSNFIPTGNALPWSVLAPDIYAPLTPQWNSIVAANA